jgi:hypothetical protein
VLLSVAQHHHDIDRHSSAASLPPRSGSRDAPLLNWSRKRAGNEHLRSCPLIAPGSERLFWGRLANRYGPRCFTRPPSYSTRHSRPCSANPVSRLTCNCPILLRAAGRQRLFRTRAIAKRRLHFRDTKGSPQPERPFNTLRFGRLAAETLQGRCFPGRRVQDNNLVMCASASGQGPDAQNDVAHRLSRGPEAQASFRRE